MKVLMLSKVFLKGHPREGELTGFREKFLSGEKKHTLRVNEKGYYRNNDFVSVRQWKDIAYASAHEIVKNAVKIGVVPCVLARHYDYVMFRTGSQYSTTDMLVDTVAANDGLSRVDFIHWMFPAGCKSDTRDMNLIYLSDFRYFNVSQ